MKPLKELIQESKQQMAVLVNTKKSSKEYKKAKRRYDYLQPLIMLIEAGLTDDTIQRNIQKLTDQYNRMKIAFFEEFTKKDPETGKEIKPKISKFHKDTGAGKIRTQLNNFKFLS
jgi:hypothetical protein